MLATLSLGCDSTVRDGRVWSGFNYSWELLSHRVAMTRVIMNEDGTFALGLIGGDWSTGGTFDDYPMYRVHYQDISATGFAVVHGETEFTIGPEGTATTTATVTDETIAGMRHQVVVLRGFEIDTDVAQNDDYPSDYDPALGYTSRGFGFGVGTPEVDGDTLQFDVEATLRWGPQDRSDMNAAIPHATTSVVVAWTAIGFKGRWEMESLQASAELEHDPPYSEHEPIGAESLAFASSSRSPEITGLQSFDLLMDDQAGTDEGGYLRRFGMEIIQNDEGVPTHAVAECTNTSVAEEIGVVTTVSAEVARIWLSDNDASVSISTYEGMHDVGDAQAPEAK